MANEFIARNGFISKQDSILNDKEKLEIYYYYKLNYWHLTSTTIKEFLEEKIEELKGSK